MDHVLKSYGGREFRVITLNYTYFSDGLEKLIGCRFDNSSWACRRKDSIRGMNIQVTKTRVWSGLSIVKIS